MKVNIPEEQLQVMITFSNLIHVLSFLFQLFMKVISLVHLLLKFNYKPNC